MDEGYIKYQIEWEYASELARETVEDLIQWRERFYDLGLIGVYWELGIGYGNISKRCAPEIGRFIVSGTQTGQYAESQPDHYAWVEDYDIVRNWLKCKGPVKASSESLTHAAVYDFAETCEAVIHVHDAENWTRLLNKLPTTSAEVPYGTPEMAWEVKRLLAESDLNQQKIFIMGGHEEGIISFGKDLQEAAEVLLHHLL